ncbi:uncharacterized protein LOC106509286 [Sus scrofa]|uniref:uncharacterized protein LOC106509286 n=1 Tax=Sus scrofa TaxID=9823 RepID=UPI0006B22D00|nr:uncharacterized protein LOC106509286 [Sus scrofa]
MWEGGAGLGSGSGPPGRSSLGSQQRQPPILLDLREFLGIPRNICKPHQRGPSVDLRAVSPSPRGPRLCAVRSPAMKTSVHQDTKPRPAVPTAVPEAPQPCAAKPQCCGVNYFTLQGEFRPSPPKTPEGRQMKQQWNLFSELMWPSPTSFGCNVSRNSHSRATRPDDPESLQGVCLLQPHPLQLDLVPLDSTDQCSFIVLKFSRPKESFGTDSTSLEVSPWEAKEKTKPHCIQTAERAGKMGKGRRLVISKDPSTPKRNLAASLSQTEHERVTGSLAVKVRCHCCGEGCCCGLGSIPGPLTSTCLRNG